MCLDGFQYDESHIVWSDRLLNEVEAPVDDIARLWYYPAEGAGTHGLNCIALQVQSDAEKG